MPRKQTHVHLYQKAKWGSKETVVWRCMLPGCSHYVHPSMAQNRKSLCHKCRGVFVLTIAKMARVRPKCDTCTNKGKELDPLLGSLDSLLENL